MPDQSSAPPPAIAEGSPRLKARIAGLFYLLTFLTGGLALALGGGRIVSGDAASTAANVLAHPSLLQMDFAADVLAIAWYVVVTALFYELFEPVSRSLSRLAACFSLTGCAIQGFASVFDLAPLLVLRTPPSSAFNLEQLQALAYLCFKLKPPAYDIGLVFFGTYCLLIGSLILKSTFLPRVLGALMAIGGLAWLTFLWPPLAASLYPYNLAPGILGEGSLTLWLVIKSINPHRWQDQAKAATSRTAGA